MKNRRFLVFVVVIIIALTLAACERSASTPPPDAFPTLEGGTSNPIDELGNIATQTAAVQNPENGGDGETESETPSDGSETSPTATPVPEDQPEATPVPDDKEYPVPDNYTLQKGEFPYCIARRFDISPGALLAANGLTSSSVTYAGETLKIPKDAGPFDAGARELRAHPDEYTVQAGDTVFSIACLYGSVDPRAIEDHNGLSGAYTLEVGKELHIP